MRVDGAVRQRKVELRREQVFHLFPDECSIRLFVFHVQILNRNFGAQRVLWSEITVGARFSPAFQQGIQHSESGGTEKRTQKRKTPALRTSG
jgi:hypothetical protein